MRLLLAGLILFGAVAVEARVLQIPAPQQDATVPAAVTDGATAFQAAGCAHCHAIRGVGGDRGPDLSGVGRRLKPDAIQKQIAMGGDAMPAFGEALPAEEIDGLVQYLKKCRAKAPKGNKAVAARSPVASPD